MEKTQKEKWAAEKLGLQKTYHFITGKTTRIIDISEKEGELGYTSKKGDIHLAYEHPVMDKLKPVEKKAFRKGVFAHEMLHQIFTDFYTYEKTLKDYPAQERRIFSTINNVLEDPAIEYLAPTVISGPLLSSLRFTIAHIYKNSPRIEEAKTPMSQFISALIQFGDMGLLKGHFTFDEAKNCFAKAANVFDKGITEPVCAKRIDYSKEILEISRPLWQSEADFEKLMKDLLKTLEKQGKAEMSGAGHGQDGDTSGLSETKKDKRRKITVKKVSKEEMEKMKGEGAESGPIPEDGDVTVYVCDEETDENKEQNGGSSSIPVPDGTKPEDDKDEKEEGSSGTSSKSEEDTKEKPETSETGGSEGGENSEREDADDSEGSKSGSKSSSKAASDRIKSEGDKDENEEGNSRGSSKSEKNAKEEPETSETGSSEGGESSDQEDADNGEDSKSSSKSSSKKEGSDDGDSDSNNGDSEDECSDNKNSDVSNKTSDNKDNPFRPEHKSAPSKVTPSNDDDDVEEDEDPVIEEAEYTLTDEDIKAIETEQERNEKELEEATEKDDSDVPDYDISSPKMPRKSCLNYRVNFNESQRSSLEIAYASVLEKLSVGIHTTTKALKRIFEDDKEEREYRNSGQISLKRLSSGVVSSQIFERKIAPANKSDLAVEILVDESGSMGYMNKYVAARECCIALAEIFHKFNVPVYIIGFTADTMGYDVVHSHYITWKNTPSDRLKLLNITSRCDNCDGASIRYATEVIKKAKAKNKLLIVISDGQPAAYNYSNGMSDTKDAIKAAKKHASVLGIAVGNSDTESIQFLYEKDFLHVSKVDDLFAGVSKKIKNIIKTWR